VIVRGCGQCFLHSVVRWWMKKGQGQSVIVPGCGSVLSSLSSPVMDEERTRSVGDCTWLWSVFLHSVVRWWMKKGRGQSMIVPGCGQCFLHSVVRWWMKEG